MKVTPPPHPRPSITRSGLLALLSLATLTTGCIAGDHDATADETTGVPASEPTGEIVDGAEQNLLVRVNLGQAQSVSFHALREGRVLITQTGDATTTAPLELPDDPLAAFQQTAPGLAVPAVLASAMAATGENHNRVASAAIEPVIINLPAPVQSRAFPREAFSCWARNRYSCIFNSTGYFDEGGGTGVRNQTYNAVWAVDKGWVVVKVLLYYPNGSGGNYLGDTWQYETYENYWRTFNVSGNFAVLTDANWYAYWYGQSPLPRPPQTSFHFSSAGPQ